MDMTLFQHLLPCFEGDSAEGRFLPNKLSQVFMTPFGDLLFHQFGDNCLVITWDQVAGLFREIVALGLDEDLEFKRWYTFAGRFMRLREQAKFELLKVLYALKLAITASVSFSLFLVRSQPRPGRQTSCGFSQVVECYDSFHVVDSCGERGE